MQQLDWTNEFFRMMTSQNLTYTVMDMPLIFSMHNGIGIKGNVTLLNHDGTFWYIPIVRSARGIIHMFGASFKKYLKEYNVDVGGGLKFCFLRGDCFEVSIFDPNWQHVPMKTPTLSVLVPGHASMINVQDSNSEAWPAEFLEPVEEGLGFGGFWIPGLERVWKGLGGFGSLGRKYEGLGVSNKHGRLGLVGGGCLESIWRLVGWGSSARSVRSQFTECFGGYVGKGKGKLDRKYGRVSRCDMADRIGYVGGCLAECLEVPGRVERLDWKGYESKHGRRPTNGKAHGRGFRAKPKRRDYYDNLNMAYRKSTLSAGAYNKLINSYMKDIDSTVNKEEPTIIDQWNNFKAGKFSELANDDMDKSLVEDEGEMSENDMLWKEMEMALLSAYLLDEDEAANNMRHPNLPKFGQDCEHDYVQKDEIGMLCRLCGHVGTEIKYVSAPFPSTCPSYEKLDG
ncbi:hypothetical protein ACFE04_021161 [Oxalis oulophora]